MFRKRETNDNPDNAAGADSPALNYYYYFSLPRLDSPSSRWTGWTLICMAGLEVGGKPAVLPALHLALCSKVTCEAKALECPPFPHIFSSVSLRGIPQTLSRVACLHACPRVCVADRKGGGRAGRLGWEHRAPISTQEPALTVVFTHFL